MIWSTSRPWKPTSVNLVASTCKVHLDQVCNRLIRSCQSFDTCTLKILTKKIDRIPSFPVGPQKPKEKKHTFTKGAYAILARRLAISVFPQPVGPIIRMFFGTISSLSGSGIRCRRHLFPAIQNRKPVGNLQRWRGGKISFNSQESCAWTSLKTLLRPALFQLYFSCL